MNMDRTLSSSYATTASVPSADISAQRMNAKIRQAQLMKVPYMLVVGENEMNAGQVSLRVRDGSQQNNIPLGDFLARRQRSDRSQST